MNKDNREVIECCEALEERIRGNNWKGIVKWGNECILNGIDVYSYCPFCGKPVKIKGDK